MKSFGSLSQPSKIVPIIETKENFSQKIKSKAQNARIKYMPSGKVRLTKNLKEELERTMNALIQRFGLKHNYRYDDKTDSWEHNGMTSGNIYSNDEGKGTETLKNAMSLNKKELESFYDRLDNGHTTKDEFINICKELKEYLRLKSGGVYNFLGKEFSQEPTKEQLKQLKDENTAKRNEINQKRIEAEALRKQLEEYQDNIEGGKKLNVFIGKNIKVDTSEYNDTDLLKKSMSEQLHYTDRSTTEYDGPTRSGSYSYSIRGTYYAMNIDPNEKITVWTIKKLLKLLEADGYTVETVKKRGYRDWKIEVKNKSGDIIDLSRSFGTSFLPKHLKSDKFTIVTEDVLIKNKVLAKQKKAIPEVKSKTKKEPIKSTTEDSRIDGLKSSVKGVSYEIKRNLDKKGIEIHFDGKPVTEVLENLKGKGYQWSYHNKCWYKKDDGTSDEDIKKSLENQSR